MRLIALLVLAIFLGCSTEKARLESRLAELCAINQQSAAVGYADSLVAHAKEQELLPEVLKQTDTTTLALVTYALLRDSTWQFTCNRKMLHNTVDSVLGMTAMQRQEAYQALGRQSLERAILASMRSDLRNLVTAEEAYFADSVRYTKNLGSFFVTTTGNTAPAITLTRDGWYATINNPKTTQTCAIFIGSVSVAPATREGMPTCR